MNHPGVYVHITPRERGKLDQEQRRVYAYIVKYKTEHDGNSPSNREIADDLYIKSLSHLSLVLDQLHTAGYIRLPRSGVVGNGKSIRSIEIVGAQWTPPPEQEIEE